MASSGPKRGQRTVDPANPPGQLGGDVVPVARSKTTNPSFPPRTKRLPAAFQETLGSRTGGTRTDNRSSSLPSVGASHALLPSVNTSSPPPTTRTDAVPENPPVRETVPTPRPVPTNSEPRAAMGPAATRAPDAEPAVALPKRSVLPAAVAVNVPPMTT